MAVSRRRFPFAGAVIYLLVGERRVGLKRARRIAALHGDYSMLAQQMIGKGLTNVDWGKHRPEARGMDRLGTAMVGVPTVAGSEGRLYSASDQILRAIAEDVDRARKSVLMEFYIWNEGGAADEVLEALIRAQIAASRVACWSTRSAPALGGEVRSRSGCGRPECISNQHCPSGSSRCW